MIEGLAGVFVRVKRVSFNALTVKSTLDIDTVLRTTSRWIAFINVFASITIRGEFLTRRTGT